MSGELYAIGANRYGQCGIDDKVIFNLEPRRVALIDSASRFDLGFQHGVALTDEGKVFVWGKGLRGQLGQGREIERSLIPIEVKFDDAIVDVSCGMNHSAALTSEGRVWVWGKYQSDEFVEGRKYFADAPAPRLVSFPDNVRIASVHCGQFCTVAVDEDGGIHQWGMFPDTSTVSERLQNLIAGGGEVSRMRSDPQRIEMLDEYAGKEMSISTGFGVSVGTFPHNPSLTPIYWGADGVAHRWSGCEGLHVKYARQAHLHLLLLV